MISLNQSSKSIAYGLAVITLTVATSTAALATTYHLQPGDAEVKDVWVQPSHAGIGDNDTLHVWKSSSVGGFKSLYEIPGQIPYLIPQGGSSDFVSSATLNLFVLNTEGGGHGSHAPGYEGLTVPIEVTAMANPWAEGTWSGGTPEAIQLWNDSVAATGSAVAHKDVAGADVGNWISLDVTEHVRSWVDYTLTNGQQGLPYYGFLIEASDEIRASDNGLLLTAYHSSAVLDSALRPYMEVTTVPVPAATWLFGSALLGLVRFTGQKKL